VTDRSPDPELDPVLHQPVRTRIAAFLAARGEATFTELKQALDMTDGNLEAHLKKLIGVDYVVTRREKGDGRPQTIYAMTEVGRSALARYVKALQALLGL
jgi:predicted ArsR family transcriptional regulator